MSDAVDMGLPLDQQLRIEIGKVTAVRTNRKLRDRVVTPAQCSTTERRGYIAKGLIAPGDVAALVSHPGAGKSVLAPYIGYGIAQGRPIFGLRTKPGRVLYAAAEDFAGMRQRVDALYRRHGDTDNFQVVDISDLNDTDNAADLLAYVDEWKPCLVVIDTLAAAWAGIEENGGRGDGGMGGVVAFARKITATGAAVLLLHHPAKHGDGTPRGHSSLNGTLDACLVLDRKVNDPVIKVRLSKNRNGNPFLPIAFKIESMSLGLDEDGDMITAPIAVEAAAQAIVEKRWEDDLLEIPRTIVDALRETISADGVRQPNGDIACDVEAWRQVFYAKRPESTEGANKRAFDRALKVPPGEPGRVMVQKPWAWIDEPRSAEDDFDAIEVWSATADGFIYATPAGSA